MSLLFECRDSCMTNMRTYDENFFLAQKTAISHKIFGEYRSPSSSDNYIEMLKRESSRRIKIDTSLAFAEPEF